MFEKDEAVVYGNQGVCVICDISTMKFGKEKREYYVLKPVYDENSTIYVPTDNESVTSKMRKVMGKKDIERLIDSIADEAIGWISDDGIRREFCESVINGGSRRELMKMIKMLYMQQQNVKLQKKHLRLADEKYLKEAEKMINEEIAYVMKIDRNRVSEYIETWITYNHMDS